MLLRIVLQDALSEEMKVYPSLKLKVFVDDITAFKELAGIAEKGPEGDETGSGGEGSKAVGHGRGEGREEQSHCVMQLCGREF